MNQNNDYTHFADIAATVAKATDETITSRVVYKDEGMNVTVFAFGAGQGLTEHTASRAAVVHFLEGEAHFTAGGDAFDVGPGAWVRMRPGLPHSIEAITPVKMLLILI